MDSAAATLGAWGAVREAGEVVAALRAEAGASAAEMRPKEPHGGERENSGWHPEGQHDRVAAARVGGTGMGVDHHPPMLHGPPRHSSLARAEPPDRPARAPRPGADHVGERALDRHSAVYNGNGPEARTGAIVRSAHGDEEGDAGERRDGGGDSDAGPLGDAAEAGQRARHRPREDTGVRVLGRGSIRELAREAWEVREPRAWSPSFVGRRGDPAQPRRPGGRVYPCSCPELW